MLWPRKIFYDWSSSDAPPWMRPLRLHTLLRAACAPADSLIYEYYFMISVIFTRQNTILPACTHFDDMMTISAGTYFSI